MAEVTAQLVKELRDRTGVGMNKCKEALVEAQGDIELAINNLRKSGMASAVKKQGREANEGLIGFAETTQHVAIVEVNCETDFVVQNQRFQEFVAELANEAAQKHPTSLEAFLQQKFSKDSELTIDEYRATLVQTIGENIQIKRMLVFAKDQNHSVGVYSHLGGKILVVVEIEGSGSQEALAKEIAMHAAAANPQYLGPESVPAEILANEQDIIRSQAAGKPEHALQKILEGKLRSFYETACLLKQLFIRDDSVTIEQLVEKHAKEAGKPLTVKQFVRWKVGE